MNVRALVLADRTAGDLDPLAPQLLPALVPVAGKPLIEHCVEDCWEAGVRELLVVAPAGDRSVREQLGDGQRFGLVIRHVESRGRPSPREVLTSVGPAADETLLVARGDMLRGRCTARFLERVGGMDDDVVFATVGSRPAGLALVRRRAGSTDLLDWPLVANRVQEPAGPAVELGDDVGCALLDGPTQLFDACLDALDGRYAGLLPAGRVQPGAALWVAPRAAIARSVHITGIARIGRGAELHDQVELAGRVDIGDRCVIDDGAQLVDCVVLPGTYVGRGVRLQNAIAHGPWLYRVDLSSCQRIDDPLLLAGPLGAAA